MYKGKFEPSGPSGWSLSWFLQHEATRSISTPPWMGCQSIAGLPPGIKFASTHLYTWVERGTVRVKCLAQEHNTMSLARAQTRTARSGDKRTNHEATAPPTFQFNGCLIYTLQGKIKPVRIKKAVVDQYMYFTQPSHCALHICYIDCVGHCILLYIQHEIVMLGNTVLWFTMGFSTCHLYFLGIP